MSVSPTPPSGTTSVPKLGISRSSNMDENTGRAIETEKKAAIRVQDAERNIETAQREENQQLDHLKDEYIRESAAEENRESAALEAQKNKGYEKIREVQRQQQAEMNRVKREGDRDLSKLTDYYRGTEYRASTDGEEKLRDLQNRQGQEINYTQKSGSAELDDLKNQYGKQADMIRENSEQRNSTIADSARKEFERMHSGYVNAEEASKQKFQEKFEYITGEQKQILDGLDNRASQKIREVRADTSEKLAAYARRQRDPFYKLVDISAKLHEYEDAYVLTAQIPEHEQKNVAISLKGSNLVVAGYRRNEEKLEPEPGHNQVTSSYQSYSESFPLLFPVEGRAMSKEFNGTELKITLPKKTSTEPYHSYQSKQTTRARVEQPQFPDNLPINPHTPTPPPDGEPPPPSLKYPGGKPLT